MLHRTVLPGLLLALSATALPAQAQMASFCGGALVIDSFYRWISPDSERVIFDVIIRNVSARPKTFLMTVVTPLEPTNLAPAIIGPRASRRIDFTQATRPGVEPPTGEQAARYVRITCS